MAAENGQPTTKEEAVDQMLAQIREWMVTEDPRPRKLTLVCAGTRTPSGGPGRIFSLHAEQLISQMIETVDTPRIVPAGMMPPNGAIPR